VKRLLPLLGGLLLVSLILVTHCVTRRPAVPSLTVYCLPSARPPVADIAAAFRRDGGSPVRLRGLAPGPLSAADWQSRPGDLCVADDAVVAAAARAGLIRETIPLATRPGNGHSEQVTIGVLNACPQAPLALKFARYLAAPQKGAPLWARAGWKPLPGDVWAERPELVVYSGGLNRLGNQELLAAFGAREGVGVTTVYNGCGILCGTMQLLAKGSGERLPDLYHACDVSYLKPVASLFPDAIVLTETDLVIAVPRGNPRGIKTLRDLARPGLRLGMCNAEQSTLGHLSQELLRAEGLLAAVRRNVVTESPTADLLVTQMRTGALDAIIVYRVNVLPVAKYLEPITIHRPGARAQEPCAVRDNSPRRQLAGRLLAYLRANRATFEQVGFTWVNQPFVPPPDPTPDGS